MKIQRARIENYKGVKLVDISTSKNMIIISGANGQGKSSVLDGIMDALAGKSKATTMPIHEGADKAIMKIVLDGYQVTRIITDKTSRLEVLADGGDVKKSPQAWLDEHIGNLKFDPSAFANMKDKDQRDILVDLAGLNLDDEDKKIDAVYQERTMLSRELKTMSNPTGEELVIANRYKDVEEVSVSELSSKYQEESEKYSLYNTGQDQFKMNTVAINVRKKEIYEIEAVIRKLQMENSEILKSQKPESNLEALKLKIDSAESDNQKIRDAKLFSQAVLNYQAKETEYNTKTTELETARDTKKQLIGAAKFPVPGLTIDDSGVLYNNIPFSQLSSSQKLTIGAMIATKLIPEDGIRAIFLKEASLLDEKAFDFLDEFSKANNVSFYCEIVDSSGKKGVYIEEGEVKDMSNGDELIN